MATWKLIIGLVTEAAKLIATGCRWAWRQLHKK